MIQIHAEASSFNVTVKKMCCVIQAGWKSTEIDLWLGRPKISTSDQLVSTIHCMVLDNRCIFQKIGKFIEISSISVRTFLTEILSGLTGCLQDGFQECWRYSTS